MCGGLQISMDLEQKVTSLFSQRGLPVCSDGSEGSEMREEKVLQTQEDGACLAVVLPAVKAADTICYVCSIA